MRSDSQNEFIMRSEVVEDTKPNTDDDTLPKTAFSQMAPSKTGLINEELKIQDEYHDLVMQT